MSTKKKLPSIQPAPVQKFTIRLVDGHFVRVPKIENIAETDATRPPSVPLPGTPVGDAVPPRRMRLVNGRFRDVTILDDAQTDAPPAASVPPPKPAPVPEKERSVNSWDFPFTTRLGPSDPSDKK